MFLDSMTYSSKMIQAMVTLKAAYKIINWFDQKIHIAAALVWPDAETSSVIVDSSF